MTISKLSRGSLCMALALAAPSIAVVGCSGGDHNPAEAAPSANTGRMQLALTARGASGALYRLRQASFQAQQQGGFGFAFLSSENDPSSTTLEATLESGQYVIELLPGWFLEKLEGGTTSVVNATLLSPALQFFDIIPDDETFVSYRFETNGEVIDFGQGRLVIDIEVDEVDGGGGGGNLGDPLEIVGGVINPGTNPHGIQAALFTAAAPVGATIAVTEDTGSVCLSGLIDPVLNDDFDTQWGALFGFAFLSEALEPASWDRDGGNVLGFSFNVAGSQIPFMRFQATPEGTPTGSNIFCQDILPSGAPLPVAFDSMTLECWVPGGLPLPAGSLANVIWQLVSAPQVSQPYDFCLSDLRPILQ